MDNKNNSGDHNSGDWNSGNFNSGDCNSGHCNSGDHNSGDWNSGHFNSGDCNSGHCNSGDHNSGNWNSGHFNTNSPDIIRLFNSWVDMSHKEFNEKYNICMDIPINKWVHKEGMTKEEKQEVSGWETMGGYLKTLDYKEACCIWWRENPDRHDDFLSLPNFDANIFKEITGIDVNVNNEVKYMVNEINKKGIKVKKLIIPIVIGFIIGLCLGFVSDVVEADASESLAHKLSGKILLQVESKGQAWYVHQGERYYLGRPEDAFEVMRALGLGITNSDIEQIPVAETSFIPEEKNLTLGFIKEEESKPETFFTPFTPLIKEDMPVENITPEPIVEVEADVKVGTSEPVIEVGPTYTLDVFSPIPSRPIGIEYKVFGDGTWDQEKYNKAAASPEAAGGQLDMIDENSLYIGLIVRDSAGNIVTNKKVTVETSDSTQNKVLNSANNLGTTFIDGKKKSVHYYPFTYNFFKEGDHTITFQVEDDGIVRVFNAVK